MLKLTLLAISSKIGKSFKSLQYCSISNVLFTFSFSNRANFSGGGLSYTEYHAHVTRALG